MERVILDVTRTAIRILATEGTLEQPRIRQIRVEPLSGSLDAEALRRALRGLNRTRTKTAIATIPREDVMMRLVRMPGTPQFPFPIDSLVTDVQIVGQEQGTSLAQVVACPRPRLEALLALLQEIGWEPDIITPSSWGLWAWCRRFMDSSQVSEPTVTLHFDVDRIDLILIYRDHVVFSRSLPYGVPLAQTGSHDLESVVDELERSVMAAAKAWPGLPISQFVLAGVGDLGQWKHLLERRVEAPVLVQPLPRAVEEASAADERRASFIVAWGLAMAERQWLVNLMPREVQQIRRRRAHLRHGLLTGSLLCAVLALGDGLIAGLARRQAHVVAEANGALHQGDRVAGPLLHQEQTLAILEEFLASRRWTRTMVAELFRLTPADVVFEELAFDRTRQELVVRGSTATTAQVMDYLRLLDQSPRWSQAALRHAISRRTAAGVRTDFEILLTRGTS